MKQILLHPQQMNCGNLILVNPSYGFLETQTPNLAPVLPDSDVLLLYQVVHILNHLMAELNGWRSIAPVSGWRSPQEQQDIWDSSLKENGAQYTKTYVALCGHSEHQTGLAIDLGLRQEVIDFICPQFPYHGICQKFRTRAADYGFIQRYPAGKEDVTGIGEEPWHFRYVGIPHAQIMAQRRMVLEEYLDFIRQFPYGVHPFSLPVNGGTILISYLPADKGGVTELLIDEKRPHTVSGNNMDGFLVTEWRF